VLSAILSRRIFNSIRSVHGLSYEASASLSPSWRNDSPFTIAFQTKCDSVPFAIHLAKEELRKMIADGPTAEELSAAKESLDSGFRRIFGRGFNSAETFAELETQGVDLSYYQELRKAYASVDGEQVKDVAKRYLDPGSLLILCVGNVEEMKQGDGVHGNRLEDFGPMTVHDGPLQSVATSPGAVVLLILDALKAGDVEGLKAHGATALLKRMQETPRMVSQLRLLPRMLETAKCSPPEEETAGDAAEVSVPVEATMGGNTVDLVLQFSMVREAGAWKCESFRIKR
jgi:hypothetical protein